MASVATRRSRGGEPQYYWPGFVDAMAQLLLVITFLLSVFIIAQFLVARQIAGQDTALSRLRSQIAELTDLLALEKSAKRELELSLGTLSDDLKTAKDDNARLNSLLSAASQEGAQQGSTVSGLQEALEKEKAISAGALSQVDLLNQQLIALRRQIAALNDALDASEKKGAESDKTIKDLGARLNAALAQQVQELKRYRSDFFGRLRELLKDRKDIRVTVSLSSGRTSPGPSTSSVFTSESASAV